MTYQMIHENNGKSIAYNSLLVDPKKLSIFSSELCLKIVQELVNEPGCAMDLARRLGQHEQKIYYHVRRLEEAGIIKQIKTEKRYSMTAKIYGAVAPIIATKLYDDGHIIKKKAPSMDPAIEKFLKPFIEKGRMNTLIVLGDSYSHGKYDSNAREGPHTFDLGMLFGNYASELGFPHYKLDTEIHESDLKSNNLILIGTAHTNTIIGRINESMPITFDQTSDWAVTSKMSGRVYKDSRLGVIMKLDSPFAKGKKILVLAGKTRVRGIRAVSVACTKHLKEVAQSADKHGNVARIVQGFDVDGNKIIDSVKFLE